MVRFCWFSMNLIHNDIHMQSVPLACGQWEVCMKIVNLLAKIYREFTEWSQHLLIYPSNPCIHRCYNMRDPRCIKIYLQDASFKPSTKPVQEIKVNATIRYQTSKICPHPSQPITEDLENITVILKTVKQSLLFISRAMILEVIWIESWVLCQFKILT